MLGAGKRAHKVRFDRQVDGVDDGMGNTTTSTWMPIISAWAGFRPRFGNESLQSGRLESTMLGTLTILRSQASAAITSADRAVFEAGPYKGKSCQIRSIVPTPDNREIEMTLEDGVVS